TRSQLGQSTMMSCWTAAVPASAVASSSIGEVTGFDDVHPVPCCYRVALDHETLATVIEHARRRAGRGANTGVEPGDGFVFTDDPTGRRPWQPNWVTRRFIRYRRQAGLSQFRLHDLRHF